MTHTVVITTADHDSEVLHFDDWNEAQEAAQEQVFWMDGGNCDRLGVGAHRRVVRITVDGEDW